MNAIAVDVVASGALAARLPSGGNAGERRGRARLDVPADSSVTALLATLGIEPGRALLVILNGTIVPPAARGTTPLADGDTLSLAPPIRAG